MDACRLEIFTAGLPGDEGRVLSDHRATKLHFHKLVQKFSKFLKLAGNESSWNPKEGLRQLFVLDDFDRCEPAGSEEVSISWSRLSRGLKGCMRRTA